MGLVSVLLAVLVSDHHIDLIAGAHQETVIWTPLIAGDLAFVHAAVRGGGGHLLDGAVGDRNVDGVVGTQRLEPAGCRNLHHRYRGRASWARSAGRRVLTPWTGLVGRFVRRG